MKKTFALTALLLGLGSTAQAQVPNNAISLAVADARYCALAGCTMTGAFIGTTVALGGATIGSNALAVTGTTLLTGNETLAGNLIFSGTVRRITGDMTNATSANRVAFQTSTVDSATRLLIIPNGTGNISSLNLTSASDPDNAAFGLLTQQTDKLRLGASTTGTGSYTTLNLQTSDLDRLVIGTSGDVAMTSASAASLSVGLNGATNSAFNVDSSTALQVAGLNVKGAVTGGTVAVSVIDSGAAANLTIDAKGSGTIIVGGTSTGAITLTRATTMSNALTYGGVTLTNAVTGTGNMVLSAGPTLSGTTTIAAITQTGNYTNTAGTIQYLGADAGADTRTITASPAVTAYTSGACYKIKAGATNATTTPTLNINALGAKTIVKRAASALAAGDLLLNMIHEYCYDGTNMQVKNPIVN